MHRSILNLLGFRGKFELKKPSERLGRWNLFPQPVSVGADGLVWNHLEGGGVPPAHQGIVDRGRPGLGGGSRWTSSTGGEPDGEAAEEDLETIYHRPIMVDEVVQWLAPAPGKILLDCTFGGGGHTRRLLARGASVVALDRDADALMQAYELENEWDGQLVPLRTTFDRYPDIFEETGVSGVDGMLLDVGVSSWQLDSPNRGFSFRFDGPLDMRMDRDAPLTAEEMVNTWPQEELARIFFEYGEERASRRVARTAWSSASLASGISDRSLASSAVCKAPARSPLAACRRDLLASSADSWRSDSRC